LLQLQPEFERYRDDGLDLVIATPDSPEIMREVLDKYELEAVVLNDRASSLAGLLGVSRVPASFLFDREGRLVYTSVGWHPEQSLPEWREKVEEALY
jgi:peroxiredoxin